MDLNIDELEKLTAAAVLQCDRVEALLAASEVASEVASESTSEPSPAPVHTITLSPNCPIRPGETMTIVELICALGSSLDNDSSAEYRYDCSSDGPEFRSTSLTGGKWFAWFDWVQWILSMGTVA